MTADPRQTARAWLAEHGDGALDEPGVHVDTEEVFGRYVQCAQETVTPVVGVCPADLTWSTCRGRHSHWTPYDTPHLRVVIRLPAQPIGEQR